MSTIDSNLSDAVTLLGKGLTISSAANPELDATYATDNLTMQGLQAEANAILLNDTFADGSTSLAWPDASGAAHTFTVAQFRTLLAAVWQFVSACVLYARGATTAAPSDAATIP